eukprot:2203409-Amphidinium_carterae.1
MLTENARQEQKLKGHTCTKYAARPSPHKPTAAPPTEAASSSGKNSKYGAYCGWMQRAVQLQAALAPRRRKLHKCDNNASGPWPGPKRFKAAAGLVAAEASRGPQRRGIPGPGIWNLRGVTQLTSTALVANPAESFLAPGCGVRGLRLMGVHRRDMDARVAALAQMSFQTEAYFPDKAIEPWGAS